MKLGYKELGYNEQIELDPSMVVITEFNCFSKVASHRPIDSFVKFKVYLIFQKCTVSVKDCYPNDFKPQTPTH